MSRCFGGACTVLLLLAASCNSGSAPQDEFAREYVAVLDQLADAYEKVTDKASYDAQAPAIQSLTARFAEVNRRFEALGPEARDAALQAQHGALDAVKEQLQKAKTRAANAAFK
jgi:hypothetical protein